MYEKEGISVLGKSRASGIVRGWAAVATWGLGVAFMKTTAGYSGLVLE